MFAQLLTPTLLLDRDRLARNIDRMQAACDAHGVALWPHIKTHKMVEVARMQLAAGARGLVCAKIGEANAMLPSGVRRLFLAHSLVDPLQGPRLRALAESLDELIVACTSAGQAEALERVLASVDLTLPVMMAVDTGQGREGTRGPEEAVRLAAFIARQPHMRLCGLYAHEGQAYRAPSGELEAALREAYAKMMELRDLIDPDLPVFPGCSATAARMAALPGIRGVRPGTYVFGDLSLTARHPVMDWDDLAVTILATVVDRPEPGLALLDAGSKTFSGDKTPEGLSGSFYDRRDIHVSKCSEEHGWVTGSQVGELRIGERVRVVPAHICPTINLTDTVTVISEERVVDTWRVAARGCVQ
jgi:D-serine deaminase-like pyridoxal phosphate-dependent protein